MLGDGEGLVGSRKCNVSTGFAILSLVMLVLLNLGMHASPSVIERRWILSRWRRLCPNYMAADEVPLG